MRLLVLHAGPRPWIGRWPPPARALAGTKVGREMRRNTGSTLLRRFLASLVLIGILGPIQLIAPTNGLARVAPTTTVSGDPDDPEGPSPAPKRSAQATTTPSSPVDAYRASRRIENPREYRWLIRLMLIHMFKLAGS